MRTAISTTCCATLGILLLSGCGGNQRIIIYGSVTAGDQKVDQGDVTFVSLDGGPGSGGAEIVDGEYRLQTDGLPPGRYRVIVNALAKTGRKVRNPNGFEVSEVDEVQRVGNPQYATDQSPLTLKLGADSDGRFDIDIGK